MNNMKIGINCKCSTICDPLERINIEVALCCYFCPANDICSNYHKCGYFKNKEELFNIRCKIGHYEDKKGGLMCGKIVEVDIDKLRECAQRE
jgi:hypothetical protein